MITSKACFEKTENGLWQKMTMENGFVSGVIIIHFEWNVPYRHRVDSGQKCSDPIFGIESTIHGFSAKSQQRKWQINMLTQAFDKYFDADTSKLCQ